MLSITKLQNLKAIHNRYRTAISSVMVVINHKTTKFESNSQPVQRYGNFFDCCYQSQNYKIWKQFTTLILIWFCGAKLLSITKLQNLKAIHNVITPRNPPVVVVINHKTTKFESNSQPTPQGRNAAASCYQSQNYKIWKQFTT